MWRCSIFFPLQNKIITIEPPSFVHYRPRTKASEGLGSVTPWPGHNNTPPREHIRSQHPPPGLCTGGRYASYWNAFLWEVQLRHLVEKHAIFTMKINIIRYVLWYFVVVVIIITTWWVWGWIFLTIFLDIQIPFSCISFKVSFVISHGRVGLLTHFFHELHYLPLICFRFSCPIEISLICIIEIIAGSLESANWSTLAARTLS